MGRLEDDVRELMKERFGSVAALARHIGMSPQTIYSALNSHISGLALSTVLPIATALEIDPYALAEGRLVKNPQRLRGSVEVPLFGTISAGTPVEPAEADDVYPIPAEVAAAYPRAFLLRVSGESMNKELPNGCYALVDPCTEATTTDKPYAIAVGSDEATVKRIRMLDNGVEFVPSSTDPTFRPMLFDFNDPATPPLSVIGRVVWYTLPTDWTFEHKK